MTWAVSLPINPLNWDCRVRPSFPSWSGTSDTSATDPLGRVTRVETDDRGRPVQAVAADGSATQMAYTNGYVTSSTDALGRATSYTRDSAGYVTKVTYADLTSVTYDYQTAFHALTTVTNERGYSTTYAYDASGHNTGSTDALGNRTTNVYDASTGLL